LDSSDFQVAPTALESQGLVSHANSKAPEVRLSELKSNFSAACKPNEEQT